MITVLYITNGITGAGGLERVLSVKASLLAEDFGYEVHLLSLNENGKQPFFSFSEKLHLHSVEFSGNPIQYFLQYKKKIQRIVDQVQPDIISVCDDGLKGFFLPQIIRTKAKWLHESHASLLLGNKGKGVPAPKKAEHQIKQILGKRFSKVILLTEGNRKEWHLKNVEVIPNPSPFQLSETSTHQNKKIIAVGSYSYNKGYDLLLQIWVKIENNFPDWKLNIYGRGTYENLQQAADNLNLRNIAFLNPVPDIKTHYLDSAIFVLPSRSEGFGMVIIEAMSCAVPVISFDCPNGPADIISNNQDGFLIENGNVVQFAEKLKTLIADFDLRQKMGKAAKLKSKNYEAKAIVKRWDELFKSLLNKN